MKLNELLAVIKDDDYTTITINGTDLSGVYIDKFTLLDLRFHDLNAYEVVSLCVGLDFNHDRSIIIELKEGE